LAENRDMRWTMTLLTLWTLACSGNGDSSSSDASAAIDADPADAYPAPSCEGGAAPSFSAEVAPIFAASCNDRNCHDSVGSAAQLDLTGDSAYASLVGITASQCARPLVTAGSLDDSYLVNKLTGNDMCRGSLMPKADQRLSEQDLDTIFRWICNGAGN
jgi:hypothetical protein